MWSIPHFSQAHPSRLEEFIFDPISQAAMLEIVIPILKGFIIHLSDGSATHVSVRNGWKCYIMPRLLQRVSLEEIRSFE